MINDESLVAGAKALYARLSLDIAQGRAFDGPSFDALTESEQDMLKVAVAEVVSAMQQAQPLHADEVERDEIAERCGKALARLKELQTLLDGVYPIIRKAMGPNGSFGHSANSALLTISGHLKQITRAALSSRSDDRLREVLLRVTLRAEQVMRMLEEEGPKIVPHLIDTDDNAGQYLRAACEQARNALEAPTDKGGG